MYRAFAELRHPYFDRLPKRVVLQGLFVGFVFVVAFGFSSVRLNLSYPTVTQAITWGGNPALFAHMVLVVGSLIALLATDGWLRVAALSLSGVGILAAGSRESAYGLLLVLAYLLVRSVRRRKGREAAAFIILGSVVVMLLGFGQMVGIGRIGFLVAPASATPGSNLVRGSELPSGDWWDTRNVAVQTSRAAINGHTMTVYRVTKRGAEPTGSACSSWSRCEAGQPTLSAPGCSIEGPQQAGLQGWAQLSERHGIRAHNTASRPLAGGIAATDRGPSTSYGVAQVTGAWKRVYATFTYLGSNLPRLVGRARSRRPDLQPPPRPSPASSSSEDG